MKPNAKISAAVAAILGVPAATVASAADQQTDTSAAAGGLQEVVVTAQRRAENLQDVPITVQAITGDQLQKLSVVSFNDLMKYTPNVSYSGNGPGTGNIFMRGLGLSGSGNQSQSTTQPFPNVALYLDDQSMQFPARNNDVYLVDMERVEILEGPQGTLFGGGAQAGAVRYITNKPKFNATSGEFNAAYGITAGGDPNSALSGVLNVPITDNFALRGVLFTERRGGYIDNVPSTINFFPGTVPHDSGGNPTGNNYTLAGRSTNPVDYQGARLSAAWKINSDWDLLVQQNYQDMHADGYFYAYPTATDGTTLNKYQITAFTPAFSKDKYESTAWTLNGKLGDVLNLVYTGNYMVRHIEGQQDYSNYVRSAVGSYYACIGAGAGYFNGGNFPNQLKNKPLQCYTSVGGWHDTTRNTHHQEELRVSTNADNRVRGTAGVYWEKFTIYDMMDFNYLRMPQCDQATLAAEQAGGPDCLSAVGPVPGAFASNPNLRTNANTAFGEDVMRGYRQTAFFTSVDVDLIPKVLTATGGVRFYKYNEFEHGSEYYSESTSGAFDANGNATPGGGLVVDHLNGVCTAAGLCGFPINLEKSETGHRFRGNLTWHIAPDLMAYYTYSEGFRPGGFNRTDSINGHVYLSAVAPYCGAASTDPRCLVGGDLYKQNTKQFLKPAGYGSDNLKNNEIGFKSQFFDHHLQLNLSAYIMKWTDVQLPLFDPVHLGNTTFDINGPSYKVKGFEVQFIAQLTEGLTLEGSSSINSAEQTNAPCLPSNRVSPYNPTPIGQCITVVKGAAYTNPYGVLGTRPPFSPPWMFNLRARYDWTAGQYKPFAWVGASHVSAQSNQPASFPDGNDPAQANPTTTLLRYEIPGYTTYDGAIGVSKDQWTAQISGSNLGNAYGPTNISSGQFIKSEIPLRPRVLTFQFGYRF